MKLVLTLLFFCLHVYAKNVLILNSYSPISEWTSAQSNSIIKTLREDNNINIYVEYMDTKAFKPNPFIENNLLNFYVQRYKNIKLDAVITTDDNAINFILKHGDNKIFEGAKFFFSGVNNNTLTHTLPKDRFAGIFEQKNPLGNLHLAKELNPELKTLYFVGDSTITSRRIIEEYKDAYRDEKGVEFVYLDVANIEEVQESLRYYEENSVMMLVVFAAFKEKGEHINTRLALDRISKVYKNPMLIHDSIYATLNGTNIIGGSCIDGALAGSIVAQDVLKYFKGTPIEDIKFKSTEGIHLYLNEKNLNRFGINIEDLDLEEEPIVVNKNNSLYRTHSAKINSFIILVAFLVFSGYIYIRNKQYHELDKLNREIKELNDTLEYKVSLQVEEIKKSTDRFKTIFNTVRNGVAILDLNARFILVNDAYERITGMPKEQFYQLTCIELTAPHCRAEFKKVINSMLQKKFVSGYTKQYIKKDGSVVDIMMDLILMPDGQGILVVARDITTQIKHKLEQKRKDEQMMQQSRLAQMGEMLSMIAHQWRQPLGAIGSAIIGMKLQLRSNRIDFTNKKEVEAYMGSLDTKFDSVNEYVQFLSATIDDFRNFFKPSQEKEHVNLSLPIHKALQIVEVSMNNKNITLDVEYRVDETVQIYTNELTQVILNILKNAEDNFVEKQTPNAQITIRTHKEDNVYMIKILDNGGGIPEHLLPKIFDPYYTTKQENGTGLGLYMSKIIVEEHHSGKLSTKNTKEGVEFTIALPA